MPRLIFSATTSLDGYTADTAGDFGWSAPDEEVHRFINDRQRGVTTYVHGRRMYETMRVWQELPGPDDGPIVADFAEIWQSATKVVYSTTLAEATTPRTTIRPVFHDAELRELVEASDGDVCIGGPTLAEAAFRAGLIDEVQLYLVPVSVGGGTPALPLDTFIRLELQEERRFSGGTVWLRYAVNAAEA